MKVALQKSFITNFNQTIANKRFQSTSLRPMKSTKKPAATIPLDWWNITRQLPPDIRLEVYDAVFDYVSGNEIRELSVSANVAFAFVHDELDVQIKQEQARKEAAIINGKKGGRPKGSTKSKAPSKTKSA